MLHETLEPEAERGGANGEGRDRDLSHTLTSGAGTGPGEEGHDASRRAGRIAVVQMVGLRIVEVHRALHEPESEHATVEVQVALRVARDGGDVMDAEYAAHEPL